MECACCAAAGMMTPLADSVTIPKLWRMRMLSQKYRVMQPMWVLVALWGGTSNLVVTTMGVAALSTERQLAGWLSMLVALTPMTASKGVRREIVHGRCRIYHGWV